MQTYLALLRGINVGGNSLIKMEALRTALAESLTDVATYIQTGNVLFKSEETDTAALARRIEAVIKRAFELKVATVAFSAADWKDIIATAPVWWGKEPDWKHNLLVLTEPLSSDEVIAAYGELKPDIEKLAPGNGVLYQSLSFENFGRTTGGKLAANPLYQKMTVRNYNTAAKLARLLP